MVFSQAAQIWIIQNYSPTKGLTQLRRGFIVYQRLTNRRTVPHERSFKRVIEKFQDKGLIKDERDKWPFLGDGDVTRIKLHSESNPKASVTKACVYLNISKSSIQRKLKITWKFKPFRSKLLEQIPFWGMITKHSYFSCSNLLTDCKNCIKTVLLLKNCQN